MERKGEVSEMADSPLCEACNALDLEKCFRQGVNTIRLGFLPMILSRKTTCGLCRLISLLISRNWCLDRLDREEVDLTGVEVLLLVRPCSWARSKDRDDPRSCAHSIQINANRPRAIIEVMEKEKKEHTLELVLVEDDAGKFGRDRAFHGRRVGAEVSIDQVRKWMEICETEHGPDCADVLAMDATEELPQGARMIDVVDMAIVEAPANCRYLALSYVWGSVDMEYVTKLKNVDERNQRDSLKSVELPRTIRDAIKLVRDLNERYLWVDALCIVQDDPVSKDTQIEGMHMIYGKATVTIVAAGGSSAHAPLPGLEAGSRENLQHIESIQSLRLAVPLRGLQEMLAGSVWDTRGWTFQEQMLSRRKLFFTNEQVFFKCCCDVFSEDTIAESSTESLGYPTKFQGQTLRSPERPSFSQRRYAREFMMSIEEFTRRQLTNPSDIYNAVLAILIMLYRFHDKTAPLDPKRAFMFGMPISLLEDAMLWQPGLDAPAHARRVVKELVTPTWSWAGWEGSVGYHTTFSDSFYVRNPFSLWEDSLVEEWVITNSDGLARRVSANRPVERVPTYFNGSTKYIGLANRPSAISLNVEKGLAPGTLLFRTTSAFLSIQKFDKQVDAGVRSYNSKFHYFFKILSDKPSPALVGRIVLPSDTDTTSLVEFVVLSRSDADSLAGDFDHQVFGKWYRGCFLNVMLVKRVDTVDGMEVSERVGVGVIVEAAWLAAEFRERVVRLR